MGLWLDGTSKPSNSPSSPGLAGCITLVGHRPQCCTAPLQIQSWGVLSFLPSLPRQQSLHPHRTLHLKHMAPPCLGGCPHLRWEAAHGVTGEHWQGHQAPFKSQSLMLSLPRLLRCNMIFLPMSLTVPRAIEVQRVCNSATSISCCPGKHLHWRISTKVLENTKNWPVQSY